MGRCLLAIALAGCHFEPGGAPLAPPGSAAPDSPQPAVDAPPGSIVFVQKAAAQHNDAGHASISAALGAQVAGNANIVIVSWYTPSAQITSVVDALGNPYQLVGGATDGAMITQRVYFTNAIAGGGANTITATFSANAQYCEVRVLEYAGLAASAYDVFVYSYATSATETVGPLTTRHPHELLLAAFTGNVSNPGTGWTERISYMGDYVEELVATATGSFTASATGNSAPYVAMLVGFAGL